MFDAQSAELLRQAPELLGVSPEDLPSLLTDIYSEIVLSRLKSATEELDAEPVLRLMEIANGYEAVAALIEDEKLRKSSAFVAGSAYQILSKTFENNSPEEDFPLSRDFIDGNIAASLLFLIAEQYPDANEAIGGLRIPDDDSPLVLKMLCESLRDLVKENYASIIDRADRRSSYKAQPGDLQQRALIKLYETILEGVELLAGNIIGDASITSMFAQFETPQDAFSWVVKAGTMEHGNLQLDSPYATTYPGPFHLATLLISTATHLEQSSVLKIVPPVNDNSEKWNEWLKYRSRTKPILWSNHKKAIDLNFHHQGKSAVIVLPTGAGKTTMAEFKIANVLASGKKVIFLAPTNALVEQLKTDLRQALPEEIFGFNNPFESDFFFVDDDSLSPLEIMTPEKCLAYLNFNPEAFLNVGLLVFDECHMLSPSAGNSGNIRRAIDSMLTVLTFQKYVPDADFLFLSAMVKNVDDFAAWISELTGRECLPINMVWKPSRQARGVVIYNQDELLLARRNATVAQKIADELAISKGKKRSNGVRAEPGRMLNVTPYALFGLTHNWNAQELEQIRIKEISKQKYFLDPKFASGSRIIEPGSNGTEIAKNIAIASVNSGYKTIVFINTAPSTVTSARDIQSKLVGEVSYNVHEKALLVAIEKEMGALNASMLVDMKTAVPHNARLINFERRLSESLFKRPDGAQVIFATTTLSQGMNLPAQVAILSADERALQDDDGEGYVQDSLKAHELLNAAGRAGRAGFLANGLVFLISRQVLTFKDGVPQKEALPVLNSILPEDEKCVVITDPLENVLDEIQIGEKPSDDLIYMFHRLLPESPEFDTAGDLLKRSFGRYMAKKAGEHESFDEKIISFKQGVEAIPKEDNTPDWIARISIQSGISPIVMMALHSALSEDIELLPKTILEWIEWITKFLNLNQRAAYYCFGSHLASLEKISGLLMDEPEKYDSALGSLTIGLSNWISGAPLTIIDQTLGGDGTGKAEKCPRAREIATNIAYRQLPYFTSLIVQIVKTIAEEREVTIEETAVLECLPNAIKYGFDTPEKLAFYLIELSGNTYLSRVEAHEGYSVRLGDLKIEYDDDSFKSVYNGIKSMMELF